MVSLQRGFAQTARRSPASPVPGIHRSRPRAGARARGAGHTEQTTNRTQNNKHHVHHIIQSSFHPKGGSSGPHRSQSSRRRERISTRHNDEGPSKSEAALLFGHTTGFVAVCSRGASHHQGRRYTVAGQPASAGREHIARLLPLSYVKLGQPQAAAPLRTSQGAALVQFQPIGHQDEV